VDIAAPAAAVARTSRLENMAFSLFVRIVLVGELSQPEHLPGKKGS
jgi:hypothetical protein